MQIFYVFTLVLVVLASFYPLSSAQQSCNLSNCSRANVEICTTNGRQCRRFSNECSLVSANCNATLATVWNQTDTIQCSNLSVNATGACSCPALRTCSNQTTATGICVHRDGHTCRLFRTECDLVRARCNREVWRNIDIMQCRGFSFNQTRTCTCPKSLLCSRNETQLCVATSANNCRLYGNECDLEGDRCQGQRLTDVNNLHCQRFEVGANGTCTCPNLLNCQRNVTDICVRNAANRCQLMTSQCDLELQRCRGTSLINTLAVQCRNIRSGETGDCACPSLVTCSANRTNICVRTRVGCRIKTNECELERSRCLGEVVTPIAQIQCRNLTPGAGGPCACPRLETCSRNVTNICIRSESGCMLLSSECDLEQARCEGRNFTIVDAIQCANFTANQLRNCSCPNMGICSANSPNLCVTLSSSQCRLMPNRCELEKARCQGEALNITSPLQCRGLRLNVTSNCFCPRLTSCSRNTTNICVRENSNACTLMRNECELEEAICEGRDITRVDNIHCRNLTSNVRGTCYCPNLATCNRNSPSICVINATQCLLIRNECELEQAKCEGNNLITTHAAQCLNFGINQQSNCSCPNLLTCSQNSTRICIRTRAGCKLLATQCELEEARCRGEALRTMDPIYCQGFRNQEERECFCSNLETCSRNTTNICVRNSATNCTLLRNACDLEEARCRGQALTIVQNLQCRNFTSNTSRTCMCPNLFNCSTNATSICVKLRAGCKLLRNQCELENERCQGPVQTMSPLHCLGFTIGQTRQCSCPQLKTCSRSDANICVKTSTGCRIMRNECELEQLRCMGQDLRVLPAIQCKRLQAGTEGPCACNNWLNCERNSSSVCINTRLGCRLLQNQCDLEERRCRGEVFNVTTTLQCQGFLPGQLRNCACPDLKTCSRNNSTMTCVRNQSKCKLMANSCDLEMAKCRGERWCTADLEECKNFTIGQQATCSCPRLQTCSRENTTNVCVNLRGACRLMRNQCELEKARCKGQAWRPTDSIQCQNYRPNEWRWCACPRLLNCCNRLLPFCVKGPNGCKIMGTDCELQMARCRGEVWSRTDDLQCKGLELGQRAQTCRCPKLETCQQTSITNTSTQVCVRNIKGCKLLRNDCELERSLCSGEVWQPVDNLQCLNFPLHSTRSCRCPALDTCSNTTRVCAKTLQNQCYNFRSECDLRWAECEGKQLSLTVPQRCDGIRLDDYDECKCPESLNCNRRQRVCARRGTQCRLFRSDCDFRTSSCRDETWRRTSLGNCCDFQVNDVKNCTTALNSAICGEASHNRCRLFASRCDFNRENSKSNNEWSLVERSNCRCLRSGRTGRCTRRFVCKPPTPRTRRVCGRHGLTYQMFESQCHLRLHNYQRCTNFRPVRARLCRRNDH
ncbi:transmembrane cell adhesion receptor mua-3-like [Lucilia cuprina]|uniref:transmembrane cell adhesion receptor mua-3-like n=1 Tax=Lucilia cuprina TaxID=7375 RepID=UPI001F05B8A5|nr:transmembrane cell adhesion receptor mua-3-like [Lucilia cuprina]